MIDSNLLEATDVVGFVDDDRKMLMRLEEEFLKDPNQQAFTSWKSEPAYKWILNNQIDVLACDFNLESERNGIEVLEETRKMDGDIPLILFSRGQMDDYTSNKCKELNITFVDKAEGIEFFKNKISEIMENSSYNRSEKIEKLRKNLDHFEELETQQNEYETEIAEQLLFELENIKKTGKIKNINYISGSKKKIEDLIKDVKEMNQNGKDLVKTYFTLNLIKQKVKTKKRFTWLPF